MADVTAWNGRSALAQVASRVLVDGIEVAPRGMRTKELRNLSVHIEDATDVLCTGIGANQSTRVVAAEALQLIGGFSDPAFAVRHAPALAGFLNEAGEFDGAYGPRLAPQYPSLVKRLTSDRDTRQAVLSVWNREDLWRDQSKDYPCTLVLGFAIRGDKLHLAVVMRSNDVNWGFKNDIFQFTQLQMSLARVLGIETGSYHHTAFSMHLYEASWPWAEGLVLTESSYDPLPDHPTGVGAETVEDMVREARLIAKEPFYFARLGDWYGRQLETK